MATEQDILDALTVYFSDLNDRLDATDAVLAALPTAENIELLTNAIAQLGADLTQVKASTDSLKSSIDTLSGKL